MLLHSSTPDLAPVYHGNRSRLSHPSGCEAILMSRPHISLLTAYGADPPLHTHGGVPCLPSQPPLSLLQARAIPTQPSRTNSSAPGHGRRHDRVQAEGVGLRVSLRSRRGTGLRGSRRCRRRRLPRRDCPGCLQVRLNRRSSKLSLARHVHARMPALALACVCTDSLPGLR